MAKLYFRYGTVGSAKTLMLLAVAHNYRQQQKPVLLIKPKLDTRFGEGAIASRAGLRMEADLIVSDDSTFGRLNDPGEDDVNSKVIDVSVLDGVTCILVDEAQFLSESFINQLHNISINNGIPVICYGLRTDFRRKAFPGSARLMEIADTIEEIKTTCAFCERKAIFNLKFLGGRATLEGPTVELGTEEKYLPACKNCYWDQISGQFGSDATDDADEDENDAIPLGDVEIEGDEGSSAED